MRFPVWCPLLVAVLGILSGCQSLRDLERFAVRHHAVLTEALGLELRRSPSDSLFRYFFHQVNVVALCAAIRDWTIALIPCGISGLDQLVCDGKILRGSIEPTAAGLAFIAQVALYSSALGVAISQACYATAENYERAFLRWISRAFSSRLTHSIPSARFSAAPGAGGRLPNDGQGQPEDAAPPDPQLVSGEAQDQFSS